MKKFIILNARISLVFLLTLLEILLKYVQKIVCVYKNNKYTMNRVYTTIITYKCINMLIYNFKYNNFYFDKRS